MAGLEKPDSGQISILDKDLSTLKSNELWIALHKCAAILPAPNKTIDFIVRR